MSSRGPATLTLSRPLDRLTAERLEQVGVAQASQADAAHHQHIPADAETLAWNRAREAEWHAAPAELEAMLRQLAPAVFNDQSPPLAIGIDVALVALLAGEFDAPVIARFLADWTRRTPYLAALARGEVRRDLDGCATAAPEAGACEFAAILLSRRGGAP